MPGRGFYVVALAGVNGDNLGMRSSLVKLLVLNLVLWTLASCGGYIDPEFRPFLEDFIAEGRKRGIPVNAGALELVFVDHSDSWFGHCDRPIRRFFMPSIRMDRWSWDRAAAGEDERRMILYHELGHCLLDRGHTTRPSIMNGGPGIVFLWRDDPDRLLAELFH